MKFRNCNYLSTGGRNLFIHEQRSRFLAEAGTAEEVHFSRSFVLRDRRAFEVFCRANFTEFYTQKNHFKWKSISRDCCFMMEIPFLQTFKANFCNFWGKISINS